MGSEKIQVETFMNVLGQKSRSPLSFEEPPRHPKMFKISIPSVGLKYVTPRSRVMCSEPARYPSSLYFCVGFSHWYHLLVMVLGLLVKQSHGDLGLPMQKILQESKGS